MDIYSDDGGRSDLGRLLDSLLVERILPKRWATRIWRSSDLPPRLEQQVQRLPGGVTWRAYTDGTLVWFAIPTAAAGDADNHGNEALTAHFFDRDGNYCAAGVWKYSSEHGWTLENVLDHGAAQICPAGRIYAARHHAHRAVARRAANSRRGA